MRKPIDYSRPYLSAHGILSGDKVTLRDYYAARWQRQQEGGCGKRLDDLSYLMGLPVNAPRDNLRDRVPFSDRKLATLSRKFLTTRAPEFRPNPVPSDQRQTPRYVDWLKGCGMSMTDALRQAATDSVRLSEGRA